VSFFSELKRRNVLRIGAAYVVAAWLVIQVVETIFPIYGLSDAWIRMVITVLAICLIPSLIFAWAFELTPEGLKKEKEVDRSQSVSRNTGKKLDRVIMVVLALALGYFVFDKFVLSESRVASIAESARQAGRSEALVESYGDKSIAVLPFVNMSSDAEQEYFSDGISEELLNLLARIPELRVISRSSAFSFKGQQVEIAEIARRLNVAHVLEGSVRKAGNRVRVTAQLIEARSDTHLWSQTWDRTLDDIFAIQDEIAASVVEQLRVTLLGEVTLVRETDPEAYTLFLQARHLGRQGTAEGFEQASDLYQQVLAIDEDYAAAWVGLGVNYSAQTYFGLLPLDEAHRLASEATDRALSIDPDHAKAHSMLGWIAMAHGKQLASAARHFEHALALEPTNNDILANATVLLWRLGRVDQAIALRQFTNDRDPVNPIGHYSLGLGYLALGHWSDAVAAFRTALRLSPAYIGAHYGIGVALLMQGEAQAALEEFSLEQGDERLRVKGTALALHALGRLEQHQARLSELIERWGGEWPTEVAQVYAWTGDADVAFEWLEHAIELSTPALAVQFLEPFYTPVHEDLRWAAFLERTGTSEAQRAAIGFAVSLPRE
jgi:TolB-like protein